MLGHGGTVPKQIFSRLICSSWVKNLFEKNCLAAFLAPGAMSSVQHVHISILFLLPDEIVRHNL